MGDRRHSIIDWTELLPKEDWEEYAPILKTAGERGIQVALAGGLAFSEYAGRLRNTKDIDLMVLPSQKDELKRILLENGWEDYYSQLEYDRTWIWRGFKNGLICDIIWTLPNHRFEVDKEWLNCGKQVEIYGSWVRLIGPEHLIAAKLFVFQRERCDWPDIVNVLDFSASRLNWKLLLKLAGRDKTLLGGVLSVFRWVAPEKSKAVPGYVWDQMDLLPYEHEEPAPGESRSQLLDTRDWFGPNVGG